MKVGQFTSSSSTAVLPEEILHEKVQLISPLNQILFLFRILHLQILQNIFTETNQSIKAYSEMHKDMKDAIKETEQRIKDFRSVIDGDTI